MAVVTGKGCEGEQSVIGWVEVESGGATWLLRPPLPGRQNHPSTTTPPDDQTGADRTVDLYDTFEHTLDGKGRLVLPASYRSTYSGGGFAVNLADCVGLFSVESWEKWRRKVEQSRRLDRSRLKYLIASVSPIQPDSQNRVTINPRLRAKIGLERDVTIVGAGSYSTVYDRAAWERFEARAEAPDDDGRTLADDLADLEFV